MKVQHREGYASFIFVPRQNSCNSMNFIDSSIAT